MFFKKVKALLGLSSEQESQSQKTVGKIKFFNHRKGFGFIRTQKTQKDVFVHIKDVDGRFHRGDTVQFEVERTDKGLRARKVEAV